MSKTLAEWLEANDENVPGFSRKIRVSKMTVYRYVNGESIPQRRIMQRILRATKGEVSPASFFPS